MTRFTQFAFATLLSLGLGFGAYLSCADREEKARVDFSFVGLGARHFYFANPEATRSEYDVQVRSEDGDLLREFNPASVYPALYADYFLTKAEEVGATKTFCEKISNRFGRPADSQIFLIRREFQNRSFDKFLQPSGGRVPSRIEVVQQC